MTQMHRWSMSLAAVVLAAAGADGQVQTAGTFGPAYAGPEPVVMLSKQVGVAIPGDLPRVDLGVFDLTPLLAEDQAAADAGGPKPLRYGVGRATRVSGDDGLWMALPAERGGGWLWAVEVRSAGATGLRLRLSEMNLPAGAEVVCVAPGREGEAVGPYTGRGIGEAGQMYTGTTWGDVVRVEVRLPAGAAPSVGFVIDEVQHLYRFPAGLPDDPPVAEVGTCHNDVTCYPAWANTRQASAGIGFVSSSNSLFCSGTMINSQASDQTPYWLTANHCLSTSASAQSAEIYWFYQTASCNGATPNIASAPRSSVTELVMTNSASDVTLVLIRGALPAGVFWAGFNTATPASGTAVTGIHHPDGSWKRLSTATIGGTPTGYDSTTHIRANWNSGVTEPGSSGSGLFRSDTQQIVGQLHGGPSACGASTGNLWDAYGAFASSWSVNASLRTALAGGSDDTLSPNATCATARLLGGVGSNSWTGLIVKSTAEDWYRASVPAGGTLTINLSGITNAYGNVDMSLFTACGTATPAVTSISTGATEQVVWTNAGAAAADVFVRVFLASSVRNTYNLAYTLTAAPVGPANNACANATVVPAAGGALSGTTVGSTNDGSASCGTSATSPDVWFVWTAPSAGTMTVNTCGSAFDTVLSLHTACPGTAGNQLLPTACNDDAAAGQGPCGGTNVLQSFLSAAVTGGTSYRIRLAGYNGATGAYTLNVGFVPSTPANDECAGAIVVSTGATGFNTSAATDNGAADATCLFFNTSLITKDLWYRYTATAGGTLAVTTCGSGFDTRLAVYGSCPSGGAASLVCSDDSAVCGTGSLQSAVSLPVTAGASYWLRVGGYNGASGTGTLNVTFTPGGPAACSVADVVGIGGQPPSDGQLTGDDFNAFIGAFAAGDLLADITGIGGPPNGPDGAITGDDFNAFIAAFAAGCP